MVTAQRRLAFRRLFIVIKCKNLLLIQFTIKMIIVIICGCELVLVSVGSLKERLARQGGRKIAVCSNV